MSFGGTSSGTAIYIASGLGWLLVPSALHFTAILMDHSSDFDPISFLKYMEHSGRAYRKQATELVSLCRVFVRLGEDSVHQDADLRK